MSVPDAVPLTLRAGRFALQLPLLAWLLAVWILLYGAVSARVIVTGVVVSLLILTVFRMPAMDHGLRLRPVAAAWFVLRFLGDLAVSSLRMVAQILGPRPVCSVLAVQLRVRSDVLLTGTAIAVSAIPGTAVVEVSRAQHTLWVHALGAVSPEEHARVEASTLALERRITRAFGTRADIARLAATEVDR